MLLLFSCVVLPINLLQKSNTLLSNTLEMKALSLEGKMLKCLVKSDLNSFVLSQNSIFKPVSDTKKILDT